MTVEKIIGEIKEELFGFVLKYIRDEDQAKDIHQEILIKIFAHYKSIKKQSSLKAWIYQIARNAINDYFRKNKIKKLELSDSLDAIANEEIEEPSKESELIPCINPFLQKLRPNYKRALELTDLGNLSQKEFAAKLNISYSGAKSTVQRARKEMRKIFKQCCKIESDRSGSIRSVVPSSNCVCS